MKTEKREKKEFYDVFIANDGTEFRNAEECKKYEESAFAVVNTKYKQLVVNNDSEESFFGFGCCDNLVDIVRIKNMEDADVVLQMLFIVNPELKEELYASTLARDKNLVERAMNGEYLVVSRGYNEETFWLVGTDVTMKEEISRICKENESK